MKFELKYRNYSQKLHKLGNSVRYSLIYLFYFLCCNCGLFCENPKILLILSFVKLKKFRQWYIKEEGAWIFLFIRPYFFIKKKFSRFKSFFSVTIQIRSSAVLKRARVTWQQGQPLFSSRECVTWPKNSVTSSKMVTVLIINIQLS